MEFRLANKEDLPQLKEMFNKIIKNMGNNNINIWDEYYPYEIFKDDINNGDLHLIVNNDDIIAAFSIYKSVGYEKTMEWTNKNEEAFYINRIGVNVDYLRQGIGDTILNKAIDITKQAVIKFMRLLVVDNNKPAIELYKKKGFQKVEGVYKEEIDTDVYLTEYGFELEIKNN